MDAPEGATFEVSEPGRERVLVAGCGAIGSVLACLLAEDGCRIDAIGRGPHFDEARTRGLRVEGIWGIHEAPLAAAFTEGAAACGPYDAILVTCKASQTPPLLRSLPDGCLAGQGRAISLQNGLGNVEKLAERFGRERSLAGRVIFGAEIAAPGTVRVTVEAEPTLIGHPASAHDDGADRWAARFARAGIPAAPSEAILGALWGKVFYNAALNPLGALLSLSYGELAADPARRRVMDRVIDEAFAVAEAEGVRLAWKDAAEYRRVFHERLVPVTAAHRSSMLQDLERGRRTEIDAICGEVCRRGDARGIDVSANRVLLALVQERSAAAGATRRDRLGR
ncbi:MAG TPA: ketopantoate reductase family protein [Candidatus Binatia bacterium]